MPISSCVSSQWYDTEPILESHAPRGGVFVPCRIRCRLRCVLDPYQLKPIRNLCFCGRPVTKDDSCFYINGNFVVYDNSLCCNVSHLFYNKTNICSDSFKMMTHRSCLFGEFLVLHCLNEIWRHSDKPLLARIGSTVIVKVHTAAGQ